jgi:hypothetical protein
MSTRSFGSLFMVASCAGAALGCYLVSLRVASERAAVEDVENRIVLAERDVRVLQTEIGTRGRLSQLERWNAGAFEMAAPAAPQILQSSFELAKLTQPQRPVDFQAPVVLASAPAPLAAKPLEAPEAAAAAVASAEPSASALLHQASLKTETREVPAEAVVAEPRQAAAKSPDRPVTAAKPALTKSGDRPGLAAAKLAAARVADKVAPAAKKSVDKPIVAAAKPVTKRVQLAKVDPLAPLADKHSGRSKDSPTGR